MKREYKFRNFLVDLLGLILTGGLWIIWIGIRECRNLAEAVQNRS